MHLHRSCFRPIAVLYEGLLSIGVNRDFPTYYSAAPIYSNCVYVRQNSKSPRDSTKCEDHFDTYFHWSVVYALSADRERTTQASMMSYSTVVFTAITIFVVVMSLPCVVMASGGENAEAGGSSDYLYYLLVK